VWQHHQSGDHVLCSDGMFGTTKLLFTNILSKFDVEFDFVDLNDMDGWKSTPTNPLTEMADIKALSALIKSVNPDTCIVVDNCFATPALQQPLKLGADIVIHSATKFIDGQGRCIGGAVVGDEKLVGEKVYGILRSGGMCLSPFNAWVFTKGLETLPLRKQHQALKKFTTLGLKIILSITWLVRK